MHKNRFFPKIVAQMAFDIFSDGGGGIGHFGDSSVGCFSGYCHHRGKPPQKRVNFKSLFPGEYKNIKNKAGTAKERVDLRRDMETRRRASIGEKGAKGTGETAEARPRR